MQLFLGHVFAFTAGSIHRVIGVQCSSYCAACWKDNDSTGVDIKFSNEQENFGGWCPPGYHCAKDARCMWVDPPT